MPKKKSDTEKIKDAQIKDSQKMLKKLKKEKMPMLKVDMKLVEVPSDLLNSSASSVHKMSKTEIKEMKKKAKEPVWSRELSLTTLHNDGDYATINVDMSYFGMYITIARKNGKAYIFIDDSDKFKVIRCTGKDDKEWKKYFKTE